MQTRQAIALVEVDQAVYNGDDVVYAEYQGVEHARTNQLQSAMHVVELGQSEYDESDQDHPRLPTVKLVVTVNDSPNEKLNGTLCDQERMGGEYATDATKEHSTYEA